MSTSFRRFSLPASALLVGGAALALGVAPVAEAASSTPAAGVQSAYASASDAVFVQTDNTAGNEIAVYQRSSGGTLSLVHTYATGGLGGSLAGAVADRLGSQGSLTYDSSHGLLYAVNAGSNTLSVFAVRGTKLLLRQVVSSGGTFPVSVAVHGDVVYALNAENGGAVQGYRVENGHLAIQPGWNRQLGLESDGTPQFTHTPGQVGFTADGSKLLVTTKAAGNDVYVYRLNFDGSPSHAVTVNPLPGTVPFAFTSTGRDKVAVVEAGTSSVVDFAVNDDGTLTQLSSFATNQAAACWIAGTGSLLYVSNAGSATETGVRLGAGGSLTGLGNTSTDAGTIDAAASPDGRYLYVQTGIAGDVDEYAIAADGSLTEIGSVTVAGAVGGQGIAVG